VRLRIVLRLLLLATAFSLTTYPDVIYEITGEVGGSTNPRFSVGASVDGTIGTDGTCLICTQGDGLLSFSFLVDEIVELGLPHGSCCVPLVFNVPSSIFGSTEGGLGDFLQLFGESFVLYPDTSLGAGTVSGGFTIAAVPEPSALSLLASVLLGLACTSGGLFKAVRYGRPRGLNQGIRFMPWTTVRMVGRKNPIEGMTCGCGRGLNGTSISPRHRTSISSRSAARVLHSLRMRWMLM